MAESIKNLMTLAIYSFVAWLIQPFVRRKLLRRSVAESMYGKYIDERFGHYAAFAHDANRPLIWIHAVSLGETRAAAILLKELRVAIPNMRLLLTNGTATGREEGAKLLQGGEQQGGDVQVWQPWDTRAATKTFMAHFKPTIGLLMETEVWPNLIASANKAQVPMVLVNARLSEKSLMQTQRWLVRGLAKLTFKGLRAVYAQTAEDANRLRRVGAKVDGIFGNLKFDITPNSEQLLIANAMRSQMQKPIVALASSREGEELLFLKDLKSLSEQERKSVQWLIVPRHPQRFDEVASFIVAEGFFVQRRGHWSAQDVGRDIIWLGDSVGEMAFYYGLSSAALLGGSFEKFGGQNLIEALACGCPVVMGMHTFNFQEAANLAVKSNVASKADDMASGIRQGLTLALGERSRRPSPEAKSFVAQHCGSAQRTAAAVKSLFDQ